jgi:hypothetical protein
MDETFPCPKCGQPLTPTPHAVSMQCPACRNFIIIPESASVNDSPADVGQLGSIAEQAILERLRAGDNIGAIKLFQQSAKVTYNDAIAAVDRIALENNLAKSPDEASKEADAQAAVVKELVDKLRGGGNPIQTLREFEKAGASLPVSTPPLNRAVQSAVSAAATKGSGTKKTVTIVIAAMIGLFALCCALLAILIMISPD